MYHLNNSTSEYNFISNGEDSLRVWLDAYESRLEELAVAYNDTSFKKYIGQPGGDLNQLDARLGAALTDSATHAKVQEWLPKVRDTELSRRLICLNQAFKEAEVSKSTEIYQLRNSINDRLLSFQPSVNGLTLSRSKIMEVLRTHPSRDFRRAVYENGLSPLAAELEARVQTLLQLRNHEAQKLGYKNYAELNLETQGLSLLMLNRLFEELELLTRPLYTRFLQQSTALMGWNRVEPWDLAWLAEQKAGLPAQKFRREDLLGAIRQFLGLMGLDTKHLPIQVYTKDIPFGGLCFSIKIPGDIRILCSPKDGYAYYRTMFHEFGHGLHSVFNRQTSYILKREPGSFNEGMAEILAYFTQSDSWLAQTGKLSLPEVRCYKQNNLVRRVLRLRTLIAQARFELEAYQNPQQNLEKLHAEMESYYLHTPLNLTPRWAASSFPTTHPIYRQNYIIGEMIAAQTHAVMREKLGDFFQGDPDTHANWLKYLIDNYYAAGMRVEWNKKVELATGEKLNAAALAAELQIDDFSGFC
jgi:oligoendopeptidase F